MGKMKITEINRNRQVGLCVRAKTEYVVLHHAAEKSCSPYLIDSRHKADRQSGMGYHYYVRKDGTVYRGRPEWAVGVHMQEKNNVSIGICAEGDYDEEYIMPEEQKDALKELLRDIKLRYPESVIKGHRNICNTSCPGKYYPLSEMMTYYRNIIASESEELSVTQYEELKKEINKLKSRVGYFNSVDESINELYKPTIEKLTAQGKLEGNEKGELKLTSDMMRILTILDHAGVFGG